MLLTPYQSRVQKLSPYREGNQVIEVEMSTEPFAKNPVSYDVTDLKSYLKEHPELTKTTRRKIEVGVKLS